MMMEEPPPPPLLLDLDGGLLQRIWEFLPVRDVGRGEVACQHLRHQVLPLVWERIANRLLPHETHKAVLP